MNRKKFNYFCFGGSLEEAVNSLPEEHRYRYLQYIINYGLHKREPPPEELPGFEKALWLQMKNTIEITMPSRGGQHGNANAANDGGGGPSGGAPEEAEETN
jgi:hypothetical protein